ncbi:MAG TPA: molybdopterin-dependent oxidoreductase [Gemmatimonadaceae bacterium]|jgi:DMSO/TMAO reductase YedYZ molybdopterin-dependent catalytic subunit|nr:molybdopterin-dependent oxidoreductase [Gemmatimonadaceae bacterium]
MSRRPDRSEEAIRLPSHVAERAGLDRRRFLAAASGALGTLALAACDSMGPRSAKRVLMLAESGNEKIERMLFHHTAMNVPRASAKAAGSHFPAYFVSDTVPVWDESLNGVWHLEVGGLVRQPLKLSLADLAALPRTGYRLDHFCVEGWTAVATRTGVRLADLARLAGVQPGARYVDFASFDSDYHESWDIESAMHPQTIVVYAQDGHYLNAAWGAPARVYSPVKLGYKNTKYLTRIMFLPERNGGYWSDRGYEWYGGV